MTEPGATAHVRYMPHRRGKAFDVVVADSGPGIRATLAGNPNLSQPELREIEHRQGAMVRLTIPA